MIGRFHALGYVHRDLYLSHVFFDATAPPPHRLRLIDLQRVLRPVWRKRRWIVKDLAALNYSTPTTMASRTDRLRWLRSYLRVAGQVVLRTPGNDRSMHRSHEGDSRGIRWTGERRALVYRILGKTFQIARHDQSRQPPGPVAAARGEATRRRSPARVQPLRAAYCRPCGWALVSEWLDAWGGGAETSTLQFMHRLMDAGIEVHVFTRSRPSPLPA